MNDNYLLIAVLILFFVMTVRGYHRGFLRIAITFIGMIIILMAAKHATPYVNDYLLNHTDTYNKIQEKITETFEESNSRYDNTVKENQQLTIESYDVPDILKEVLIENNTEEVYKTLLANIFEEYISAFLAKKAVNAISFIFLFVIFILAFKIVLGIADIIAKIPIIKGINKTAGAAVGIIEAVIITWIFFFFVMIFVGDNFGVSLLSMISESKFLSYLFNSNILFKIFG